MKQCAIESGCFHGSLFSDRVCRDLHTTSITRSPCSLVAWPPSVSLADPFCRHPRVDRQEHRPMSTRVHRAASRFRSSLHAPSWYCPSAGKCQRRFQGIKSSSLRERETRTRGGEGQPTLSSRVFTGPSSEAVALTTFLALDIFLLTGLSEWPRDRLGSITLRTSCLSSLLSK